MPKLILFLLFVSGGLHGIGQNLLPCQPRFDMSSAELKQVLTTCLDVRRVLQENSARQTILLLKDGRVVTYHFQTDVLYSIETLWTFPNRKAAEDLFYSIYDRLVNDDATPIEFTETPIEIRLIAETEEMRFSLFIQDLQSPNVTVTLLITEV